MAEPMSEEQFQELLALISAHVGREVLLADTPHELDLPFYSDYVEKSQDDDNNVTMQHKAPVTGIGMTPVASKPGEMSPKKLSQAPIKEPTYYDLEKGEKAPEGIEFAAWQVASVYADFYIGKTNKVKAKPFFNEIFQDHRWDFFYLYSSDHKEHHSPFLFVPTAQFVLFLEKINRSLDIHLTIPVVGTKYFCLKFGRSGTPIPRFLGSVRDAGEYQKVVKTTSNIPAMGPEHEEWASAPVGAAEDSKEALNRIYNFGKGSASAQNRSKKKAADNLKQRQDTMIRVLDAIGLLQDHHQAQQLPPVIALDQPLPHPCDLGPVFMSVDIEAVEGSSGIVSEIGLTFLDMEHVKTIAPGEKGQNWWPNMKSWHVRVREYSGLRNYKYLQGCPEDFQFGKSTFPPKSETLDHVKKIIARHTETEAEAGEKKQRDVVLVAHDISADEKLLAKIGYDTRDLNAIFRADSQELHKLYRGFTNGRSLGMMLTDLGIEYKFLHNGGNDARYALVAAVACALAHAKVKSDTLAKASKAGKGDKADEGDWTKAAETSS